MLRVSLCEKLSDVWQEDVADEVKLGRKTSVIRWICGFSSQERKKSGELRESLGLEPSSFLIGNDRLR